MYLISTQCHVVRTAYTHFTYFFRICIHHSLLPRLRWETMSLQIQHRRTNVCVCMFYHLRSLVRAEELIFALLSRFCLTNSIYIFFLVFFSHFYSCVFCRSSSAAHTDTHTRMFYAIYHMRMEHVMWLLLLSFQLIAQSIIFINIQIDSTKWECLRNNWTHAKQWREAGGGAHLDSPYLKRERDAMVWVHVKHRYSDVFIWRTILIFGPKFVFIQQMEFIKSFTVRNDGIWNCFSFIFKRADSHAIHSLRSCRYMNESARKNRREKKIVGCT